MEDEPRTRPPGRPPGSRGGRAREDDAASEGFHRQWQSRLYLRLIALALLVAYAIAFVLENNREVSVHFVFAPRTSR